jgi:cell division septum initiation protein DivIVA
MCKYKPQAGDTLVDELNGKIEELKDQIRDLETEIKELRKNRCIFVSECNRRKENEKENI